MSFRAQRSFEGFQTRLGRAVQPQPIDALERMLQSEAQGALWSAIQLLSPKLKQVLMLRLVRGLSYQAIAAELSIPVGTVKSRINLATKRLRPCFS